MTARRCLPVRKASLVLKRREDNPYPCSALWWPEERCLLDLPTGATLTTFIPNGFPREDFTRALEFDVYQSLQRTTNGAIAGELDSIEVTARGFVEVSGTWISDVSERVDPAFPDRVEITLRVRHHAAFIAMVTRLSLARRWGIKWRKVCHQPIVPMIPDGDALIPVALFEKQQPYRGEPALCEVEVLREHHESEAAFYLDEKKIDGGVTIIDTCNWLRVLQREAAPTKRPREEPATGTESTMSDEDRRLLRDPKQRRIQAFFSPRK